MAAQILDGKALSEKVRRQVAEAASAFTAETGVVPGLTVVLVGEDPASQVYVRNKAAACKAAGMSGTVLRLPAETTQPDLLATIDRLNADPSVHGILVQLPLPRQIDESIVVDRVDPAKDVDGFHPANFGLLAAGTPRFVPCTPLGIRELLLEAKIPTQGAHAVVLGRSRIVGRPLAFLLLQKGPGGDATVTVCHTATPDAAALRARPTCCSSPWAGPSSSRPTGSRPARSSSTSASINASTAASAAMSSFPACRAWHPTSRPYPAASAP